MRHEIVVLVVAFGAGLLLYPPLLSTLARHHVGQRVAAYGPATHRVKEGTATFGGVLFCAIVIVAWLALDRSREGFIAVFALLGGAALGALDDAVNIQSRSKLGLGGWNKIAVEAVVGALVGIGLVVAGFTHQFFPGVGAPDLGWGMVPLTVVALVAASNAVNLTDGADGLAASCTALVFFGLSIIAVTTRDLHAVIIAAALTGSIAAFLVYNWSPARIFMGDTGALALGSVMVALSAELHLLWALPLLGIVFVVETASVIINVGAIRRYGRRVFRASPLHHHFEELGLREDRLVGVFAALAAVGTGLTVLYAHFAGPAA